MPLTQSEVTAGSAARGAPAPGLLATIATEVVPRLMRAHRGAPAAPSARERIEALAALAARQDLPAALAAVDRASLDGWSFEAVFLQLIGPAARRLGQQWADDDCSFVEVSVGVATLQHLVNVLSARARPWVPHRGCVVLSPAPGEQHTLGVSLAAELMRRDGWSVQLGATDVELLHRVAAEPVAMVGFTVSGEACLNRLVALSATVRKASMNRELMLMVGGSLELEPFASAHGCVVAGSALNAVRLLDRVATVPPCPRGNCDEKRGS